MLGTTDMPMEQVRIDVNKQFWPSLQSLDLG